MEYSRTQEVGHCLSGHQKAIWYILYCNSEIELENQHSMNLNELCGAVSKLPSNFVINYTGAFQNFRMCYLHLCHRQL